MAGLLEHKSDGSVALFIRGDLQFDSTDERVYHECLALPPLAIAARRVLASLRVLIIGGGDGLVAREILKSPQVASVDLVDYDSQIINFARTDLTHINDSSLLDARMSIHIQDGWEFVDDRLKRNASYDVIVSDLTVPDDIAGARFHSIDWYAKLANLLTERGVLSVNGVSPQATPKAYWSIFNSMSKAGLKARPYHIYLPSFTMQGFGEDWGFFIASRETINAEELDENLSLAEPRHFLKDINLLLKQFEFPEELFQYQAISLPALAGSDILLRYFQDAQNSLPISGAIRSSLTIDAAALFVPEADTGTAILPPEISSAVAKSLYMASNDVRLRPDQPEDAQIFLYGVLDLMPSLNCEHTQEVIEDFLADPESFLQAVDLPGLVARLLKRALELPAQLVKELELLRDNLQDWAGDHMALLNLGRRVVTILMLVIVVGNLLYPDMVYGKGEAGGHGAGHAAVGYTDGRGRGHGGSYWNNGSTYWVNRKRTIYQNEYVNPVNKGIPLREYVNPADKGIQIHEYANPVNKGIPSGTPVPAGKPSGMLPASNHISSTEYTDASRTTYPARRFRIHLAYIHGAGQPLSIDGANDRYSMQEVSDCYAAFRLGPGADILPSGHAVLPLTEQSYLLITKHVMHLIDHDSGISIMSLDHDATLLRALGAEVDVQLEQLKDAQPIASYLSAAKEILMGLNAYEEREFRPLVVGGTEVFPGAWITANGKYVALRQAGGELVYLDGKGWYIDEGKKLLGEPYPTKVRAVVSSYLSKVIRDAESTQFRLLKDKSELSTYLEALTKELTAYKSCANSEVAFGSRNLHRAEAIRLTDLTINKIKHKVALLARYMEGLPDQIDLAKIAVTNLASRDAQKS